MADTTNTDDLKKISLATDENIKPVTVVSDDKKDKKMTQPKTKRRFRIPKWLIALSIPVVIIIIMVAILGIMLLPVRDVIAKGRIAAQSGQELAAAVKTQNIEEAKQKLVKTRTDLTAVKDEYSKLLRLKAVPLLGLYIADGEHALNAAFAGLDAGDRAIEALEPNADLLGLKGDSNFVAGSADERIQLAVKTMSALTPKINEMAQSIDVVRQEIDHIDPDRYPEQFRGTPIRQRLIDGKNVIDNAANLFVNAQPLLVNLPHMLGEPDERRYLILFQNDKELRATGGFLTAYAQFRFDRGKAILEASDDMYDLDAALTKRFPVPDPIKTYHKGVTTFNLRDSNLSPDYLLSMKQFEEMYQYVAGREQIDGIIAVDTHVLVEALKILGPLYVSGREFSAEIDPRCDCPKAVYELEDYSTRPVGYIREDRKDIIGILFNTMLKQALGVSPSQYWGPLFQMLLEQINQKHVLTYFHDPDAQAAGEAFNMAGRIMTASESAAVLKYEHDGGWDYLHINNSNMAGQKANMFTKETMTKEVKINDDGTMTTNLTIVYDNPFPGSDCNLESGGLCLNAPLRTWLRVYVPEGSTLVESKGTQSPTKKEAAPMITYDELDKTVFEGFLVVNPESTSRVELTYTSPVKPAEDGKYRLLIQKQPGTDDQQFTLKVSGKKTQEFELLGDQEFVL